MSTTMKQLARDYGVVGAGGAGFPTHVKLNAQVDTILINGAECEPMITVDQVLMRTYAPDLMKILDQVRVECGAKEAVLAIKAKHEEVLQVVEKASQAYPYIRVHPLEDKYPAGDEQVLVYEVTGRLIPSSGLPLDCGVVVMNVETLWNLGQAQQGHPVTDKWVTIAGEVERPGTYRLPIGMSAAEAIALAGGVLDERVAILDGGPMMGKLKTSKDPITKTTKALLVLPGDNPVIQNRVTPLEAILRQARSVCCQCSLCTDLCPRHLLGHDIEPNKTILAASYAWEVGAAAIPQAYLCSECGACDMYACTMGLSPRRVNQMLKGILAREKTPNPYKGKAVTVRDEREYRRIPTKRLVSRLGIGQYHSPDVFIPEQAAPQQLTLLLRQHVGAPSVPVVNAGDWVEAGQLIAEIPENAMGSRIFTPLAGRIKAVNTDCVTIQVGGTEQ